MAVTGDHYVGVYEGHTIELIRNNWVKKLSLWINGKEVGSESCMLPHTIKLSGILSHNGVEHVVEAASEPRGLFTDDSIRVNGQVLSLEKRK